MSYSLINTSVNNESNYSYKIIKILIGVKAKYHHVFLKENIIPLKNLLENVRM